MHDETPNGIERRHLEMLAATIAAGLATDRSTRYLHSEDWLSALVRDATKAARKIQKEVRKDA